MPRILSGTVATELLLMPAKLKRLSGKSTEKKKTRTVVFFPAAVGVLAETCRTDGLIQIPASLLVHAKELDYVGFYLYCVLVGSKTRQNYPNLEALCEITGIAEGRVWRCLQRLRDLGYLNNHDLEAIEAGIGPKDDEDTQTNLE